MTLVGPLCLWFLATACSPVPEVGVGTSSSTSATTIAVAATATDSTELVSACDQQLGFCTSYPASWFFRIWDNAESESSVAVTSAKMDDGMAVGDGMWIKIIAERPEDDVPFDAWMAHQVESGSPSGFQVRDVEDITIGGLPAISQVEDYMDVIDSHPGYSESVYIDSGERRWRISAMASEPENFERHRSGFDAVLRNFEFSGPKSERAGATGRYFGHVKGIEDLSNGEMVLEVDIAHFLGGDEAGLAAVEDGVIDDMNHLSNPFYIRDLYPDTSKFQLQATARVELLGHAEGGELELQRSSVQSFLNLFDESAPEAQRYMRDSPIRITVADGLVLQITQQFLP